MLERTVMEPEPVAGRLRRHQLPISVVASTRSARPKRYRQPRPHVGEQTVWALRDSSDRPNVSQAGPGHVPRIKSLKLASVGNPSLTARRSPRRASSPADARPASISDAVG
jgi:hypothetical protein